MKSQVLHTVWCNISGEAAGEIWNWSLLGMKGRAVWLFSFFFCWSCVSSRVMFWFRFKSHSRYALVVLCTNWETFFFTWTILWLWSSPHHRANVQGRLKKTLSLVKTQKRKCCNFLPCSRLDKIGRNVKRDVLPGICRKAAWACDWANLPFAVFCLRCFHQRADSRLNGQR